MSGREVQGTWGSMHKRPLGDKGLGQRTPGAFRAWNCESPELWAPWMQDARDNGCSQLLGYRVPRTVRSWSCGLPGYRTTRVVAPQGAGAQDCGSMGRRASEVVAMSLRVNSELLRQEGAKWAVGRNSQITKEQA